MENGQEKEFLKEPDLFDRIDFELSKRIAGEENTRRAIFLSKCSTLVDGKPIHTLVNSESSAGKSWVAKAVFDLFPNNIGGRDNYRTKISPEALTYWHHGDKDWNWDGKILYLEDANDKVLNSSTFKVMCSEGSFATVVKDQKTINIEIKGKPAMLVTTASGSPSLEVANRFNFISLDESKEQTERILNFEALSASHPEKRLLYSDEVITALSCLDRKKVKIPFADELPKYFPRNILRTRRDFHRFLSLIQASTSLHQQQRNQESEYLLADETDYKLAQGAMKVIGNEGVMGIHHRLKKAFECCKKFCNENPTLVEERRFSAKQIHAYSPIVSLQQWYGYLDQLCQKNLLNIRLEKLEESDKKVTTYGLSSGLDSLNLPSWDNLIQEVTAND